VAAAVVLAILGVGELPELVRVVTGRRPAQ
jgi:hypothetical protein